MFNCRYGACGLTIADMVDIGIFEVNEEYQLSQVIQYGRIQGRTFARELMHVGLILRLKSCE